MIQNITVSTKDFKAKANAIYDKGRRNLSAMFACDEREVASQFAVYCIFMGCDSREIIVLKTSPEGGGRFPSLTPDMPAAAWYEREIHDMFGLVPEGHPDLRRLVHHENWPEGAYPLRRDFEAAKPEAASVPHPLPEVTGEGVFEVPVGPIHAGIIEPGHFRFSQAGENVINLEAKLFFTHRGIEKSVEDRKFEDAFYNVERVCGACTVSHALSYAQAVERLTRTEISRRASYLRVLAAEMERLYNHVGDIGNLCAGLGFAPGISHGSRIKETLMRLNETVVGSRFLRGLVVPGGAAQDITGEIAGEIRTIVKRTAADLKETLSLLEKNDAFLDRVNSTGVLPREAALDLGVVGVAARASGVNFDLRRDYPYEVYQEFDFKVPVYTAGDVAARLWVRAEEAFQAISLIEQCLAGMPDMRNIRRPLGLAGPYQSALGWSESPRGANLHWVMAGENNRIFRCFIRSASYPNWPAVALAAPGNIIADFPLINKSFELCYACLDR